MGFGREVGTNGATDIHLHWRICDQRISNLKKLIPRYFCIISAPTLACDWLSPLCCWLPGPQCDVNPPFLLLAASYARSEDLAPGSTQNLALLGLEVCQLDNLIGQNAEAVSRQLGPEYELFIIPDARSTQDDTALLVARSNPYDNGDKDKNGVETVRIAFKEAGILITALEMRSLGFQEPQDIVSENGVYGYATPPQQGGRAPRKRLCAEDGDE